MGLSFLVPKETGVVNVTVRWGDYDQQKIVGPDDKPLSVWQRHPREEMVAVALTGASEPVVQNVPGSGGLQLHIVERTIAAQDLEGHLPPGTRSVSVFLVNHRTPIVTGEGEPGLCLRLPAGDRGAKRPILRAAAGPARCAGGGVGRAGRRSALCRHARVCDRARRLG
jgi:hypothetical protein